MIDWPSYNESLVRRGQVLLDFDVLDGWDLDTSITCSLYKVTYMTDTLQSNSVRLVQ